MSSTGVYKPGDIRLDDQHASRQGIIFRVGERLDGGVIAAFYKRYFMSCGRRKSKILIEVICDCGTKFLRAGYGASVTRKTGCGRCPDKRGARFMIANRDWPTATTGPITPLPYTRGTKPGRGVALQVAVTCKRCKQTRLLYASVALRKTLQDGRNRCKTPGCFVPWSKRSTIASLYANGFETRTGYALCAPSGSVRGPMWATGTPESPQWVVSLLVPPEALLCPTRKEAKQWRQKFRDLKAYRGGYHHIAIRIQQETIKVVDPKITSSLHTQKPTSYVTETTDE